jgi:hypothetical protein
VVRCTCWTSPGRWSAVRAWIDAESFHLRLSRRGGVLMGQTGARDHRIDGDRSRHAPRAVRALVCRQSAEMMPWTGGERNATDMRRDRPPCPRCVMCAHGCTGTAVKTPLDMFLADSVFIVRRRRVRRSRCRISSCSSLPKSRRLH